MSAYGGVRKIINDNPIEGLQTVLESLVDQYGTARLLAELATVSFAKAEHIREAWQDNSLAERWEAQANRLAEFGHKLPAI